MNNDVLSIYYPIISAACSLLISLFGLFSPFVCSEKEFINDANWHIAKLRGFRIDKLKGFISEVFNLKLEDSSTNEKESKVNYITDIYECFTDDIEDCIIIDNKIKQYLKKYRGINTAFMLILWFSVAIIILSLICKWFKIENIFITILFIFSIILAVLQLANILYLRYLCISSQDTYLHNIFRGMQK